MMEAMRRLRAPRPRWARIARWALAAAALPPIAAACGARSDLEVASLRDAGPDAAPPPDAPPPFDAPPDVPPPPPLDAAPDVTPVDLHGCADGTREAFRAFAAYPDIAGCAGAFSVPGIAPFAAPSCGRKAGNDGALPDGQGCRAVDLCAPGFHVCAGAAEVAKRSPDGCKGALDADPESFFATGQSGPGCAVCATGTDPGCGNDDCVAGCAQTASTTNDLFGCGTAGAMPDPASCAPLDVFSNNECAELPSSWSCPNDVQELLVVTKTASFGGGVLCCRD
jgi:hypothetical protein